MKGKKRDPHSSPGIPYTTREKAIEKSATSTNEEVKGSGWPGLGGSPKPFKVYCTHHCNEGKNLATTPPPARRIKRPLVFQEFADNFVLCLVNRWCSHSEGLEDGGTMGGESAILVQASRSSHPTSPPPLPPLVYTALAALSVNS